MFFAETLLPRLDPRAHIVSDVSELAHWERVLTDCSRRDMGLSWDTETSGFQWFKQDRVIGHVFGYDAGDGPRGVYLPIRHQTALDRNLPPDVVTAFAQRILGDPAASVCTWNGKFDVLFAMRDGIDVKARIDDGMIAVALVDENRSKVLEACAVDFGIDPNAFEMKDVVKRVFDEECRRRRVRKKDAPGYAWIPVPILGQYASKDGYNTLAMCRRLLPDVRRYWPELYAREMKLLRYLVRAEWVGTPIDIPYLQALHARAEAKCEQIVGQIHALARHPLRVSSDDELRRYLYDFLSYPITHTTDSDLPSVDERALKAMIRNGGPATAIVKLLLDWREQDKIISTYTEPIIAKCDDRGVLHGTFKQVGTNTGRLSSASPNLQNIPSNDTAGIRRAFLVPRGKVRIYLDYSQIELRVLAYYAREPTMTDAFIKGEDIHTRTSLELFSSKDKKLRRVAKVINFGLAYGMSALGVMENLNATAEPEKGIDYVTEEQAEGFLARFHERYPRVNAFCRELCSAMSERSPPQFRNVFGRCRRIPEINAFGWMGRRAERQAIASIIQGTAADIAKEGMVRVGEKLDEMRAAGRYDGDFVLTVHDENQIDVDFTGAPQAVLDLKAEMERFPQFDPIPIIVEAEWSSATWADKKPVWGKE